MNIAMRRMIPPTYGDFIATSGWNDQVGLKMNGAALMPVKHGNNTGNMCLGGRGDVDEFTANQRIALFRKVTNTANFEVTGNMILSRQIDGSGKYRLFFFQAGGVGIFNPRADAAGGNIHQFTTYLIFERQGQGNKHVLFLIDARTVMPATLPIDYLRR